MFKKFNTAFYRTWEFYFSIICILQVMDAALRGSFWFIRFLQLALGLYAGYLAFFKPRSWIKKTWHIFLVIGFIVSWTIIYLFIL
ncbi:hypothetical protein [Streptococcus iners]|uniref:Uncharacterized protein n=1 Tax=Streptococcus iners subsp. hyiners TaxID=3028083 RepID=A0AA97A1I1_9STRE|nr:hypothetical protein [Streptococcus sp. 29892]MCK4029306.1 hypothetical protein [Streptococcus suis]WNY49667.1 hypothetical protein PW220_03230 [Streptococcus sp. 29892]